MDQILIILTAIIFYLLGRYTGREVETIKKIQKEMKRKINPPITGPIDYITPEKMEYYGSEKEKIDKQQEELARRAGIL